MTPRSFALTLLLTTLAVPALADAPTHRDDQTTGTPEQLAAGEERFAELCTRCHGAKGQGTRASRGPRLNSRNYLAIVGNAFLFETIKNGRPESAMYPWGMELTDDEVNELVFYLRSWQVTDGVELDESPLKGDVEKGGELFALYCESCHGKDGGGYRYNALAPAIGRKDYLDHASNGLMRAVIEQGKDDTPMNTFKEGNTTGITSLKPKQIDSVIAWLRDNAW